MRRLAGSVAVGAAIVTAVMSGAIASARTAQTGGSAGAATIPPAAPVRSQLQDRLDMLPIGGSQLGVSLRDIDAAAAKEWKLSSRAGVLVASVERGGAGERGGLRPGDVISDFDGEHVRSVRQLRRLLGETPDGLAVKVGVVREGRRVELSVTPGPAGPERDSAYADLLRRGLDTGRRPLQTIPSDARSARGWPGAEWSSDTTRLGIATQEVTPQLAEYFGAKEGVLVSSVTEGSPAAKAGLRAGDIVTAIDGAAVKEPTDLARAIGPLPDGKEVALTVVRDRKAMTVKVALR
jgi:serine protease Do